MHVNESKYYIETMNKDIAQLVKQKTWEQVIQNDIPPWTDVKTCRVLKGTW